MINWGVQSTPPPAIYSTPSPIPSPAPTPARSEVDASVEYDSQFADVIVDLTARYDLVTHGTVLPYAQLVVSYDTQPGTPGLSEVYNEDAVIPSAGLRLPLGSEQYGELFAQGGYSFGLQGQLSFPETRFGFDYSRDYGSSFRSAYPHAQLNGELIDYSRFAGNIIGAADAHYDARLATSLRALIGADLSFDDHREYGNNYAEAYGGFRIPLAAELDLDLTGVEGFYFSRGVDVPNPASYSSFRITLSHYASP